MPGYTVGRLLWGYKNLSLKQQQKAAQSYLLEAKEKFLEHWWANLVKVQLITE